MKNILLISIGAIAIMTSAHAAVFGNWTSSGRSWNEISFGEIKTYITDAGHTVEGDEAITALNLANNTHFIIGEASASLTGSEATALTDWITDGGILLHMVDSTTALSDSNAIQSAIGSSMAFTESSPSNAPLTSGNFASEGPPFDIVGETLTDTPGKMVTGGIVLAGSYIHYEKIGDGYVYAFGDRLDHAVNVSATNTNTKLFLNIAGAGIPEPSAAGIFALGALLVARRRR